MDNFNPPPRPPSDGYNYDLPSSVMIDQDLSIEEDVWAQAIQSVVGDNPLENTTTSQNTFSQSFESDMNDQAQYQSSEATTPSSSSSSRYTYIQNMLDQPCYSAVNDRNQQYANNETPSSFPTGQRAHPELCQQIQVPHDTQGSNVNRVRSDWIESLVDSLDMNKTEFDNTIYNNNMLHQVNSASHLQHDNDMSNETDVHENDQQLQNFYNMPAFGDNQAYGANDTFMGMAPQHMPMFGDNQAYGANDTFMGMAPQHMPMFGDNQAYGANDTLMGMAPQQFDFNNESGYGSFNSSFQGVPGSSSLLNYQDEMNSNAHGQNGTRGIQAPGFQGGGINVSHNPAPNNNTIRNGEYNPAALLYSHFAVPGRRNTLGNMTSSNRRVRPSSVPAPIEKSSQGMGKEISKSIEKYNDLKWIHDQALYFAQNSKLSQNCPRKQEPDNTQVERPVTSDSIMALIRIIANPILLKERRSNTIKKLGTFLEKMLKLSNIPAELKVVNAMFLECTSSSFIDQSKPKGPYLYSKLKRFTPFPEFPIEIQLMIWRCCLPIKTEHMGLVVERKRRECHNIALPITLSICQTSRQETKRHYIIKDRPFISGVTRWLYPGQITYNKRKRKFSLPRQVCIGLHDTVAISADIPENPPTRLAQTVAWYAEINRKDEDEEDTTEKDIKEKDAKKEDANEKDDKENEEGHLKIVRHLEIRDIHNRNWLFPTNGFTSLDLAHRLPSVFTNGSLKHFTNLHTLTLTMVPAEPYNCNRRPFSPEEQIQLKKMIIAHLDQMKDGNTLVAEENIKIRDYVMIEGQQMEKKRSFLGEFYSKMATHIPDNY